MRCWKLNALLHHIGLGVHSLHIQVRTQPITNEDTALHTQKLYRVLLKNADKLWVHVPHTKTTTTKISVSIYVRKNLICVIAE
jgi:hypothetical protein